MMMGTTIKMRMAMTSVNIMMMTMAIFGVMMMMMCIVKYPIYVKVESATGSATGSAKSCRR